MGSDRKSDSSSSFIDDVCAINCAAIDHGFADRLAAAKHRLSEHPEIESRDIFLAAACGHAETVQEILAADPDAANRKGGPRDWTPLLYLCFSRLMRDKQDPGRTRRLLETAKILLESGADANTFFMLGDEKETALYAACGVCNNAELASLLLKHGADVNDEDATYHVATAIAFAFLLTAERHWTLKTIMAAP